MTGTNIVLVSTNHVSRRRHRAVTTVAAAVLAVIAVAAAGCGSSGSSTKASASTTTSTTTPSATKTWATGVCTAIMAWKKSVTSAADSLKSTPSKAGLSTAANNVTSATKSLESGLKGLGKPDASAGQKARNSVQQLSTSLSKSVDTIKTTVQGASGLRGIVGAAPTVRKTVKAMKTDVTSTVTDIQGLDASGELKSAFAKSSACSSLKTG